MGRLGIRIANAVLFTLCSFQVASMVNDVSADALRPGPPSFASAAAAPVANQPPGWEARKPILERNLFGAQMFAEIEPEPEPVEDLEETTLPVRLLGTQLHSIRANSKAAIAAKGARDHELLYEGDTLEKHPQARLIRIERGRVILDNRGRREELLLADATAVNSRPTPPPRDSRRRRRASRPSRAPSAPITERLRDLQGSRRASAARKLSQQAKITPKWEEGEMVGIELTSIEPGSLYEKVGLEAGDVITSLNGIQLDSAAAGTRALAQIDQAEEFEIELSSGEVTSVGPEELEELLSGDEE